MALLAPLDPLELLRKGSVTTSESLQQQQIADAQSQAQMAQAQANIVEAQKKQDEARQLQAYRAGLAALGKNPSSEGFAELRRQFPQFGQELDPEIKRVTGLETDKENTAFIGQGLPAFTAFAKGRTELGVEHLKTLLTAYEGANKPEKAANIRALLEVVKTGGPLEANGMLGGLLNKAMGKEAFDGFIESRGLFDKEAKAKSDREKAASEAAEAETKSRLLSTYGEAEKKAGIRRDITQADQNTAGANKLDVERGILVDEAPLNKILKHQAVDAGAEAARLQIPRRNIEREEMDAATRKAAEERMKESLPARAQERLNKLTDEITAANAQRARTSGLAAKFDLMGDGFASSGINAKAAETLKSFLGSTDGRTQARRLYEEMLVTKAAALLKNFKPASDTDSKMVFKPFPENTDNPQQVAEFIRSMDKVAELNTRLNDVEKQYISMTKGTGTSKVETFKIMGVEVNPGDTLEQVQDKVAKQPTPAARRAAIQARMAELAKAGAR